MTFRRAALGTAIAVIIAMTGVPVYAQSLDDALAGFKVVDYQVRRASFYSILSLADPSYVASGDLRVGLRRLSKYAHAHPGVASALITLLERENRPDPAKDNLTEDGYYGDLIGSVAGLRDPRAVDGLLGVIASGRMAENGLADLGAAAIPGLLRKLRSQRDHELARSAAASVLGAIALHGDLGTDAEAVKAGLLSALSDPSAYVRVETISALRPFSGTEVRQAMKEMATKDPAVYEHSGKRLYPVRLAAMSWLSHDDSVKTKGLPQ